MSESARLERKKARQENERARIIEGAKQVILEQGAHNLSIGKVAKEVNILPSALYYYFKSADAIYDALTVKLIEEEIDFIMPKLRQCEGLETLTGLINFRLEYYLDRQQLFLIFYHRSTEVAREVLEEKIYPASWQMMGFIEQELEKLQQAEKVKSELHPRKIANLAFLLTNGLLATAIAMNKAGGNMKFAIDDLAAEANKLFLAALTK